MKYDILIKELLGTPYKHGGRSPAEGFDCLGLVWYVLQAQGIEIPDGDGRTIEKNWYEHDPERLKGRLQTFGVEVDKKDVKRNDILYFEIKPGLISHLGVAIDTKQFIHCLEGRPVGIDRLDRRLWRRTYAGARRADDG